jgi:hypothetical protein
MYDLAHKETDVFKQMERGKEFTFADRKPIQQGFIPSE